MEEANPSHGPKAGPGRGHKTEKVLSDKPFTSDGGTRAEYLAGRIKAKAERGCGSIMAMAAKKKTRETPWPTDLVLESAKLRLIRIREHFADLENEWLAYATVDPGVARHFVDTIDRLWQAMQFTNDARRETAMLFVLGVTMAAKSKQPTAEMVRETVTSKRIEFANELPNDVAIGKLVEATRNAGGSGNAKWDPLAQTLNEHKLGCWDDGQSLRVAFKNWMRPQRR